MTFTGATKFIAICPILEWSQRANIFFAPLIISLFTCASIGSAAVIFAILLGVASGAEGIRARAREDKAIIRNRLKIEATVKNARAFLRLQEARGSFDVFIWGFTEGRTVHNAWKTMDQIPASTPLSDKVSRALKAEGFSFVGSTICYSLLQAAGVVNDHLVHCFRYRELAGSA